MNDNDKKYRRELKKLLYGLLPGARRKAFTKNLGLFAKGLKKNIFIYNMTGNKTFDIFNMLQNVIKL